MARILAVGIAALDVICTVERYPEEDAEVRATERRLARGGNATNTLVVLSQLGHACAWAGVLGVREGGDRILGDLARHRIGTHGCRLMADASPPTSYIVLSRATGSRTIVHYRHLPEYGFDDFRAVDPSGLDWVHFEGRNVAETARMMARVRAEAPATPVSLEVEKPRPDIESLFPLADVVLFSRHFARATGHSSPEGLLRSVRPRVPNAILVCAWGEAGASALSPAGEWLESPAFPPAAVTDTVGAGDVFNAGCIDGLLRGRPLAEVLVAACRLAGAKCGRVGLEGLAEAATPRP
ncbi:MAG: PfkB family carbohydrate kinase [Gammaproteobacteria bacterium]|nr:PfkB family carbohydrate kinase [Gammaproteobacteria bacterium]